MASLTALEQAPRRLTSRLPVQRSALLFALLLALVAFLVLYPIVLLVINSFQVGALGQESTWGLANWRAALSERQMREALLNTLTLTITRQAIAFILALPLAWLLARTNLPGRHWLEFLFWLAFFLPPLTLTMGWIVLLDGQRGLVNRALTSLPFFTQPPFDIFSWWGIVFTHLVTGTLAVKVMLLTPAFRNMDASLEEAAHTLGSSTIGTLLRIVIPVMAPAILIVLLLGTIRSIEAFEIELVLGAPRQIDVYSTLIYRQVFQEPPQYGTATAMSLLILVVLLPLVVLQQWLTQRRSHTTVTSKHNSRLHDLGPWRWPAFGIVSGLIVVITIIPIILTVLGTFMKLFGSFEVPDPWTLRNWQSAITHPLFMNALRNTIVIGLAAALLCLVLSSLIAYVSVRTRYYGRGALDFLTWMPVVIPGIVIGLGFLWMFLQTPVLRPVYGTLFILVLAVLLGNITIGSQIAKASIVQLGSELEEASWACGGTAVYTVWRVILPLITPTLAIIGVLTFVSAARATSLIVLLSTGPTQPLSILQLQYLANGQFETAAVVGVIVLLLTTGVAVLARVLGLRLGLQEG
jgi:iron(III) transport system permease protein